MRWPRRIKVGGYAASELDMRKEVTEKGDFDYRLLTQWNGTHVIVLDKANANRLSNEAWELANYIDTLLIEVGGFHHLHQDERRMSAWAMKGIFSLSEKLSEMGRLIPL